MKHPDLGFITIQGMELTPDYAHAKIYVSVLGSEKQQKNSIQILNDKSGYLHSLLYKIWRIHTIPTLKFIYDDTQDKAFAMNKLIQNAIKTNTDYNDDAVNLRAEEDIFEDMVEAAAATTVETKPSKLD